MANPLLYSTLNTSDYFPSEKNFPWLGPDFQGSDSFIYDMELFLNRVPSLEEIIAADAYGSRPPVQTVTLLRFQTV